MENQTKFHVMQADAVSKKDGRKMTFVVSDEKVNRYGHKVMVEGWNLKNYKLNPVVLMNHDASVDNVVGNATRVWKNKESKQLMANIEFVEEGLSPTADLAYALYDAGILNSVSPGYLVDYEKAEYGKKEKDPKVTFNGQELIEISLAIIPANPGAFRQNEYIINALEEGIITDELLDKVDAQWDIKEDVEEDEIEDTSTETDLFNIDEQEEVLDAMDDPFEDYFKAFDCIIEEHKDSKDPDKLAGKIIESIESTDSDDISDDDLDSILTKCLS